MHKMTNKFLALLQELPSDTEDSGPPPMAPPPLPADYTGGMGGGGLGSTNNGVSSSSSAAANNMGWNMAPPPANVQPQTSKCCGCWRCYDSGPGSGSGVKFFYFWQFPIRIRMH